jgi:excisionase family DNA binding protein
VEKPPVAVHPPHVQPLLTLPEVATILRLSVRTVRRLIVDEKLATVRIGRAVRIRTKDLMALLEK